MSFQRVVVAAEQLTAI